MKKTETEKINKIYKILNIIYICLVITSIILFSLTMTTRKPINSTYALLTTLSVISCIILNTFRKKYKRIKHDLYIRETAIKDALDDKILK